MSRRKVFKNLNIRIAEGKFPEKDNEILIGDSVHKTSMNVGDTVTIKIDNHYEKFVISGIIDKQEAQLVFYLANRNKSNDGNKCKK